MPTAGPLEGVRVLDFCWVWAGPMMSALLGDLGAEVIKVESRTHLDNTRRGRPMIYQDVAAGDEGRAPELQPLNHGLNRNKTSVTIDLQTEEGSALLRRLAARCDVVCDNFRAGVMERHGLGAKALHAVRKELVILSLSGAGQWGPWRDLATFAPTVASLAGLNLLIGYAGEAPLGRIQASYGDTNAALYGALAILHGIRECRETGRGMFIDLSQWASALCGMEEPYLDFQMNARSPLSTGNDSPHLCPHNNYRCDGDDNWISIAVGSDREWDGLARVLDLAHFSNDARYADAFLRWRHRGELDADIETRTRAWDVKELERTLRAEGVAAAQVMNIGEQFADPHLQARELFPSVLHPLVGEELVYGIPWRFSRTPATVRKAAPLLGEGNDHVFRELLGMSSEEIAALEERGAIY